MEQATLARGHPFLSGHCGCGALVLLGIAAAASRWVTWPVERAWRQQRQFLSDASHELKTPLTVILSNAELLEGAALPEKPARWSGNIRCEAEQMRTLVEQMPDAGPAGQRCASRRHGGPVKFQRCGDGVRAVL